MSRATVWAATGALVGALVALLTFAPARWAAWAVQEATEGRVVLAEARGTVWSGQARVTLTGGPGSRDALTLPGVLDWRLGWGLAWGPAVHVALAHTEVMPAPVLLTLQAGFGHWSLSVPTVLASPSGALGAPLAPPARQPLMQWPAAWLAALGTPWNTLQPSGLLRLYSPGAALESAQGRMRLRGSLTLEAADMASRLSTLERLGSYQVQITGSHAGAGAAAEGASVQLSTLDGALQLSGAGQWVGGRFRLRGEARAAPGQEAALQNLLNLIGPRDGARSVLSIG